MEMLLSTLSYGNDPQSGGGDSFCDRLSCRYTIFVLSVLALFVTSRVHLGDPMRCWCPSHFKSSHIAYANKVGHYVHELYLRARVFVSVRACVCVCARVCARACVRVCVRA